MIITAVRDSGGGEEIKKETKEQKEKKEKKEDGNAQHRDSERKSNFNRHKKE
jgi:hypothetical protein